MVAQPLSNNSIWSYSRSQIWPHGSSCRSAGWEDKAFIHMIKMYDGYLLELYHFTSRVACNASRTIRQVS